MQSKEELREEIAPTYADRRFALDELQPVSAGLRAAAVIAAWLIPGAGHLLLRRYGRALLFFGVLVGAFCVGLALDGRLFWPSAASELDTLFKYDLITVLWSFAQIGSGLCYGVCYALGFGLEPRPEAPTFEYAYQLMNLAGLLNYLVVIDAFDIAAGRKR